MCNQCEDIRRIHGKQSVWVIYINNRPSMQAKTMGEAERMVAIMKRSRPDDRFDIVEDNTYYTRWE